MALNKDSRGKNDNIKRKERKINDRKKPLRSGSNLLPSLAVANGEGERFGL